MPRVIITVPDHIPQPYKFELNRKLVTIGRGSVNDIAIDSGSVSTKHAEMTRVEGGYELRDLGSTNGTKVNGQRKELIRLRHGMTVLIGDAEFKFTLNDEERDLLTIERGGKEEEPDDTAETTEKKERSDDEPKKRAAPRKPVMARRTEGGATWIVEVVLFLLFAGIAFFAGLSIRYYKDTDRSLFYDIRHKSENIRAMRQAETMQPPAESPESPENAGLPAEPAPVPVPEPVPQPEPELVPPPFDEPDPAPQPDIPPLPNGDPFE